MRDTTTSEDRDDTVRDETVRDETVRDDTLEPTTEQPTAEQPTTEQPTTEQADLDSAVDDTAGAGVTADSPEQDEQPKRKLGRRARRAAAKQRAAAASDPDAGADGSGDTVVLDKESEEPASATSRTATGRAAGRARKDKTEAGSAGKAAAGNAKTSGTVGTAGKAKAKDAKASASATPGRSRRLATVITALLVIAVLLAVILLVQLIKGPGNGSAIEKREDRREAARQQAELRTARLFSFDYRKIDDALRVQQEETTGDFSGQVQALTTPALRPIATKTQAVVQAVALTSAVVDDRDGKGDVDVLVFLDQAVTSTSLPAPRLDRNRVVATMRPVGNEWKVAGIKAL